MTKKSGQITIEYVVLIIIIMAALVATGAYIKRGIQGRWKEAVDDLGDQYDPVAMHGAVTHKIESIVTTKVLTEPDPKKGGYMTKRWDYSEVNEEVIGDTIVETQR